ncbi:MAG: NAD(P)H-hydrate epimerase [Marinosulfonomonas sp.]|nr:NAD(P)H-hydrate epimerase [Marinosulfonomonas sp.]
MEILSEIGAKVLESAAIDTNGRTEGLELMNRAGRRIVELIAERRSLEGCTFTVFCGPGFVGTLGAFAAKHLVERQHIVQLFYCDQHDRIDERYPKALRKIGPAIHRSFPEIPHGGELNAMNVMNECFDERDIVIDAVFGRELTRPIGMYWREILGWTNGYSDNYTLVALDLPSGYDAGTGEFIDYSEAEIIEDGYITNMVADRYDLTISVFGDCPAYRRCVCGQHCGEVVPLDMAEY